MVMFRRGSSHQRPAAGRFRAPRHEAERWFTLSTHVHDSGFDNIDYVISAVLVTTSGIAFQPRLVHEE